MTLESPRNSHLFACHKFLEETGSQILTGLAKFDFRNLQDFGIIHKQIENYVATLKNHAQWEEEFIFKKFFTQDEVSPLLKEHITLENQAEELIAELNSLPRVDLQSRIHKGKSIYLNFRLFYSTNLLHFHEEETTFLSQLQARATDEEIRAIDKLIYENMSAADLIEMLEKLLPPTNPHEKKAILEDINHFNPHSFNAALPKLRNSLPAEIPGVNYDPM